MKYNLLGIFRFFFNNMVFIIYNTLYKVKFKFEIKVRSFSTEFLDITAGLCRAASLIHIFYGTKTQRSKKIQNCITFEKKKKNKKSQKCINHLLVYNIDKLK